MNLYNAKFYFTFKIFQIWIFQEYENQETVEAKAVKDLDKFDMILQAFEYEKEMMKPNFLQDFFDNTEGNLTIQFN